MRWISRQHNDHLDNMFRRVRSGFLLFPRRCYQSAEYRWLEFARWTEWYDGDEWVTLEWLDNNDA